MRWSAVLPSEPLVCPMQENRSHHLNSQPDRPESRHELGALMTLCEVAQYATRLQRISHRFIAFTVRHQTSCCQTTTCACLSDLKGLSQDCVQLEKILHDVAPDSSEASQCLDALKSANASLHARLLQTINDLD